MVLVLNKNVFQTEKEEKANLLMVAVSLTPKQPDHPSLSVLDNHKVHKEQYGKLFLQNQAPAAAT